MKVSSRLGKHFPGKLHQLLPDKFSIEIVALGVVYIKCILPGRHYHCQIIFLRIPLDPGTGAPVNMASKHAMQKVQGLIGPLLACRHSRKYHFIHRKYDIDRYGTH